MQPQHHSFQSSTINNITMGTWNW